MPHMTTTPSNLPGFGPEHACLVNAMPVMACVLNARGEIAFVNRALQARAADPSTVMLHQHFTHALPPHEQAAGLHAWRTALGTGQRFTLPFLIPTPHGHSPLLVDAQFAPLPDLSGAWLVTFTERQPSAPEQAHHPRILDTLLSINAAVFRDLDVERVVQAVTDAGVELTGAQFGAFFYTDSNQRGERLTLYTLSGAPREAFSRYPLPRMTPVFGPTFRSEGIVRSDDITGDDRYGHNAPYYGLPEGHLPVRSYLAVPVGSRSGETIGSFFFGHEDMGVFTEQSEQLAVSLATQAAVALENAQLYQKVITSERRYRSLIEATAQMVWRRSPDGVVLEGQPEWQQFTGQSEAHQLGFGWLNAIHPDDRERTRQAWTRAYQSQTFYHIEHRVRRHDGEYRVMQVRATPVRDDQGHVIEWVGVHEDVTERRVAEQQLRDREARYRALVEHAVVGVALITPQGDISDINLAGAMFLGLPRDELIGKNVQDVTHADDVELTQRVLASVVSGTQDAATIEKRYVRPDGTARWSNSSVSAVRAEDGRVQYLVAVLTDITELKQAEAALRQLNAELEVRIADRTRDLEGERSFLHALLESLTEGIVACDARGQLTLMNDAALALHERSDQHDAPEAWPRQYQLYRPDGVTLLPLEEVPLYRAFTGEVVRDAAMAIRTRNGETRFLTANANAIYNTAGEKIGAVVAMRDVTEQQRAEQAVLRMNDELQRSNADLNRFAAVASHDLKSPLRTITSYLQLLERRYQGQLDEKATTMITFTVDAARRMNTLIDDVLAYSRLERQRNVVRIDPEPVMREVLSNLDFVIRELNAVVTVEHLPAVLADETQLRQVLQNLVGNALKFHAAGRTPTVLVRAERTGNMVIFHVRDNGIGIPERQFERIFGIFERLHSKDEIPGSGIGLAIVRRIIEEHGGHVWVESTVSEGTTFHFTLPAGDVIS